MNITPLTGMYSAADVIKVETTTQDPPFTLYGLSREPKEDAMKVALNALLLWEEMMPKTAASKVRSEAIEALQKYV
jgi:hypothetical protein